MRNNRFSTLFAHSNHQANQVMRRASGKKANDKPVVPEKSISAESNVNVSAENNDHVVFLSIDYDGCGSCLTNFSESVVAQVSEHLLLTCGEAAVGYYQARAKYKLEKESVNNYQAKQREFFLALLHKDIANAKDVRLMIGSNRQTKDIDITNAIQNCNGLVMLEFPKLAQEQKWQYDDFLYGNFSESKVELLKRQIEHVKSTLKEGQYATIHFYDDRDDILRKLIEHIESKDMPANVRLNLTKVVAKSGSEELEILPYGRISSQGVILSAQLVQSDEVQGRASLEQDQLSSFETIRRNFERALGMDGSESDGSVDYQCSVCSSPSSSPRNDL